MRRVHSIRIALAGLALAIAPAAHAGLESVCSTCGGQPQAEHVHKPKARKVRHLCAACAAKENGTIPADAIVAVTPGCTACATSTVASAPVGSAPGFAVVGEPSSTTILASPSSPPGYASVGGGAIASAEPAPVGVMRTNYSAPAAMPGTLGASVNSARGAAPNPAMGGTPYARPDEVPPSLYAPQRPRRSVLSRLFVPDFGRRRAEAESRNRERHAMISYGAQSGPSDLPASVVYGGK